VKGPPRVPQLPTEVTQERRSQGGTVNITAANLGETYSLNSQPIRLKTIDRFRNPYAVTFQYSINYTRLTALHNLADTSPTDGSCSKAQVATLEGVVRAHEGGAYEAGSHTRAGRDYISSANMLSQIRTRAEASVTVWPVTQDANQWLRGNVLNANGLDAAMGSTHAGAAAEDAVTYMANTFGCTLRT
jgi:hypothetical protein